MFMAVRKFLAILNKPATTTAMNEPVQMKKKNPKNTSLEQEDTPATHSTLQTDASSRRRRHGQRFPDWKRFIP